MPKNPIENSVKWSRDLVEYLEIVVESSVPAKCDQFAVVFDDPISETKVSLSFYLVPGVSPLEYFSRFIRFDTAGNEIAKNRVKLKNTIIGHIDFLPDIRTALD